jgi:hypothetical protein
MSSKLAQCQWGWFDADPAGKGSGLLEVGDVVIQFGVWVFDPLGRILEALFIDVVHAVCTIP